LTDKLKLDSIMSYENRISLKITAADQDAIEAAIETLVEKLSPHLKALAPGESQQLMKAGDGNLPFVEKTLEYAESNPEFVPLYLAVPEFRVDVEAVKLLNGFIRALQATVDNLQDSAILSGHEAMFSALTYYNSVKQAAKTNVPNAKTIQEELAKRFKHSKKTGDAGSEETTAGNGM